MADGSSSTSTNVTSTNESNASVHASNVMESPNSISSVDMNNPSATPSIQQQQQQQQYPATAEMNMQPQVHHHVPQASPHNTMTAPSPAASVASNVHAPSLPSQSPHSQHNMTSPHPQPSPHQTSPHPMTISPAAHSPYASGGTPQGGGVQCPSLPSQSPHNMPQPQPSPQPSQSQQQQGSNQGGSVGGRQSVQAEQRSPHQGQQLQYAQQHQHPAQMHHIQQQMSRFYGQYPNYAAAAAMSAQHQQAQLGRLQAAGMASMFPPNPMFNLHPPTTPPKQ